MSEPPLLVSAGEASGDRFAAAVVRSLARPSFGLGGAALEAAGSRLVARLEPVTGTGLGALAAAPRLVAAARALLREAERRRVRAALLVDFTEFHRRLGPLLRRRGVRVLWAVAPQVWAWRPGRVFTLAPALDRLALLFAFEEPLWRRAGVDARWVGHPAADLTPSPRPEARRAAGLSDRPGPSLALLPGSRPNEVRRLLPPMLEALERLRERLPGLEARVLLAPSLPADVARRARREALARHAPPVDVDESQGLSALLPAFDAAICASGTATLEAALCDVPPVITYRLGPASAALARLLLRGRHVGLPNVLLDERAYPELLQDDATPEALARAALALLERPPPPNAARLRALLRPSGAGTAASRSAELLTPWL
jgi:lipid-A-disaccharide synthase